MESKCWSNQLGVKVFEQSSWSQSVGAIKLQSKLPCNRLQMRHADRSSPAAEQVHHFGCHTRKFTFQGGRRAPTMGSFAHGRKQNVRKSHISQHVVQRLVGSFETNLRGTTQGINTFVRAAIHNHIA